MGRGGPGLPKMATNLSGQTTSALISIKTCPDDDLRGTITFFLTDPFVRRFDADQDITAPER